MPDLNRHGSKPWVFKTQVSTYSTNPAYLGTLMIYRSTDWATLQIKWLQWLDLNQLQLDF